MNKTYLIVLVAALLATPLGFAHPPMGTPKTFCEPTSEWRWHDYGPASTRHTLVGFADGVTGTCNGTTVVDPGTPCVGFNDPADPATFYGGLCDSMILADYDGHSEYALGGAFLLVESGTGFYDPDGSGSLYCYGEPGHHPAFPVVFVDDYVLSTYATYIVGIDRGPSPNSALQEGRLPEGAYVEGPGKQMGPLVVSDDGSCGDGLVEVWQTCASQCSVLFPPGLDGAYYVFVEGTQGHVWT